MAVVQNIMAYSQKDMYLKVCTCGHFKFGIGVCVYYVGCIVCVPTLILLTSMPRITVHSAPPHGGNVGFQSIFSSVAVNVHASSRNFQGGSHKEILFICGAYARTVNRCGPNFSEVVTGAEVWVGMTGSTYDRQRK